MIGEVREDEPLLAEELRVEGDRARLGGALAKRLERGRAVTAPTAYPLTRRLSCETLAIVCRAALVVLALALGSLAGGCGGGDGDSAGSGSTVEEKAPTGDPERGKEVFLTAGCGTCHTFKAAGTTKTIGPDLDLVVETYDEAFVKKSIEDPAAYIEKVGPEPASIGGDQPYHATMPSFGTDADTPEQQLDQQELADVVAFLTEGRSPSTTAPEAASPEAAPLEGTWRTDAISPRDTEATLRRYGLEKWIKPFRPLTPFTATTTLILDIKEGEWDLYGKPRGGPREEIDYDAEYVVKGNKVDKIHATGVTTYRWSVDGDTLMFDWLKSTEPPFEGIPDEVFSRALYMTRDFKRQG